MSDELPPLPDASARMCGLCGWRAVYTDGDMANYARAAVEREREACAKVCDSLALRPNFDGDERDRIWAAGVSDGAHQLAAEIRARAKA